MGNLIASIAAFVIAIATHEFAHGWMAYKLGDNTAKNAGRLTLNPLAHLDPVGTVILPLFLIISRSPVIFGWAKPVPINIMNFRRPKEGLLLTGLAGPAANLLLAIIFALILKSNMFSVNPAMQHFLLMGVLINLILGIFNLIPIPPLDGSNILIGLLPTGLARIYARIQPYGFIILIALLYLGLLDKVIWPIVGLLTALLIG